MLILKGMTHRAWNSDAFHVENWLMQRILQNTLLVSTNASYGLQEKYKIIKGTISSIFFAADIYGS